MWYLLDVVWNDFNFDFCGAEADRTFDVSPIPLASSIAEVEEEVAEVDIVAFARDQMGFVPEASQLEFLKSKPKRGIANCSRQFGKSKTGGDQGASPGLDAAGEFGVGGESDAEAARVVFVEGEEAD